MKKIWSIDIDNDNELKGLLNNSVLMSDLTPKEFKDKTLKENSYGFDIPSNVEYHKKYNWLVYRIDNKNFILAVYEKD